MPKGGAVAIKPPATRNAKIFAAMGDEQVKGLEILIATFLHRQRLVVLDTGRAEKNGTGQKFQPKIASKMKCPDKKCPGRDANMSTSPRSSGRVDGRLDCPGAEGFPVADGTKLMDV